MGIFNELRYGDANDVAHLLEEADIDRDMLTAALINAFERIARLEAIEQVTQREDEATR